MSDNKNSLFSTLKEIDCCHRCILYFLGTGTTEGVVDSYLNPEEKLESIQSELNQPAIKRKKKNICMGCLGILEDSTIEQFVLNICLDQINYYKSEDFSILISIPKCVLFRIYSIYLYLKEISPEIVEAQIGGFSNRESAIKRIFRIASSEFISKRIDKIYKAQSNLSIEFEILYEDDENELQDLKYERRTKNFSRYNVDDFLTSCTEQEFRAVFPVPPHSPNKLPTCKIKLKGFPLYLGGRYLKFSREMGQTPFIVNGRKVTETSVEDVLFETIRKNLKFTGNMTFSCSGREDSDTRMLGDGRPFYIQIDDPAYYDISYQQYREIEEEILQTNLCAVLMLQSVPMNKIREIKNGEEFKRKQYKALCYIEHPDMSKVIETINNFTEIVLEIFQQTPIRVLHRRSISTRPKKIYSMSAAVVPDHPHLFELLLITQAGTYVKEFVNSDFERTTPSITSILGFPTDVVYLDVMKVELDWP